MKAKSSKQNRHELIRQYNERLVLWSVGNSNSPISRVVISEETGLSRPTVNLLIDGLRQQGVLREAGTRTGVVGRPTLLIEVNPNYSGVGAISVSSSEIILILADITGQILHEERVPFLAGSRVLEIIENSLRLALDSSGITDKKLLSCCISEPGISSNLGLTRALAPNVPNLDDSALTQRFDEEFDCPVIFENDVNLAALGEMEFGTARGENSFAFLLVDTGIGMGFMVNGDLLRGAHGAAGEAGYLPLGDVELKGKVTEVGALEAQAGAAGLLKKYTKMSNRRGVTLDDLFSLSAEKDRYAMACITGEIELISRAVLSAVALVDPAFIVLGGSIGARSSILSGVQTHVHKIAPLPVKIVASTLGDRAAVLGALSVSLNQARIKLGLPPSGIPRGVLLGQ